MNNELRQELLERLNKVTENLNAQILEVQSISAALRMEVEIPSVAENTIEVAPAVAFKPEEDASPKPQSEKPAAAEVAKPAPAKPDTVEPAKKAAGTKKAPKEEPLILTKPINPAPANPDKAPEGVEPLLLVNPIKS